MHVAIVGTYPPRACGIATFTADVERALHLDPRVERVSIVAVGTEHEGLGASPNVIAVLDPDDITSFRRAAAAMVGVDVVLIEHEFGLFGGPDGANLLEFVDHLTVPMVVTLHTVTPRFSDGQATVIAELARQASAVQVFTSSARRLLLDQRLVKPSTIRIVPHGAPMELYRAIDPDKAKAELGWTGWRVVSTFGLLSAGKGVEQALSAIARVVRDVPDLLYVVAGRTHPEVVRREGERYRDSLVEAVRAHGLEDHVQFLDRFLTMDELADVLAASEVFCTPYLGEDQIVSGALTFAVAAGCPVVSTPYRYAQDLLADGAGVLVPFGDPSAMAAALCTLLTDEQARAEATDAARRVGRSMSWPAVGRQTAAVLADSVERRRPASSANGAPANAVPALPIRVPADHLKVLVDDTGMLQHAEGAVARWEAGYCVDDVARLVPISYHLSIDDPAWATVTARMLAYLRAAAFEGEGLMRNFCSFDRRWLDEPHQGDHVGRALWGLGELIGASGGTVDMAQRLALDLTSTFTHSNSWIKNDAYAVLGLAAWGPARPTMAATALSMIVDRVAAQWHRDDDRWPWFESRLTYDNARLPEALIRGGAAVGNRTAVAIGLDALAWLDRQCVTPDGSYRFPGCRGLGPDDRLERSGDEQPLEASAFVDAHAAAFEITGDRAHLTAVDRATGWFVGHNRLGLELGSTRTGGCCDGLTEMGVNQNQGAESTLAFQRSVMVRRRLALRAVHPHRRGLPSGSPAVDVLASV